MCRVFTNHILPFGLAAFLGITAFYLTAPIRVEPPELSASGSGSGIGYAICKGHGSGSGSEYGSGSSFSVSGSSLADAPLKILAKPRATYTELARQNETEGTVRLKVTLLASGDIGSITAITELPNGLTEQAIAAARQIQFEPTRVNGVPVSKVVTIDYSFEIY